MAKNGAIIPICFMVVSGCSVFDGSEMTTETPTLSVPVAKSEAEHHPIAEVQPAPLKEVPGVSTRSVSADDIRRLQLRLRELGFNPGPADGVAGLKTKTAFGRLEMGCAKLEPLSENLPLSIVHEFSNTGRTDKVPSRADTIILQSQLRSAGFDPGPVDGIPGSRTKALIAIVHSSCSMAKEFHGALDQPARAANLEASRNAAPESVRPATSNLPSRNEAAKTIALAQPPAQDEVRILQLRLRDAGFDPGPFDGVMGTRTKAALAQYEASQRNRKTKVSLTTNVSGQY